MVKTRTVDSIVEVYNSKTKKWVKASGAKGREILGSDVCKVYPESEVEFKAKSHQKRVTQAFMKRTTRGMLLMHSMGSGKSCSYAMIADTWLSENPNEKIIVVTSGSLRENFLSQYCSVCGKNTKNLLDSFIFISYNSSTVMSKLPKLDNTLIIIDEVHNILNARVNESPTISALFEAIAKSKNTRIVVGSGSPIVAHIEELYYLTRLIKPDAFRSLAGFMKIFYDDQGIMKPLDEEDFLNRLSGAIDYVRMVDDAQDEYPTVNVEHINVPISDKDHLNRIVYWRSKEMRAHPPSQGLRTKKPSQFKASSASWYLAVSAMHSRQTGNFVYPSIEKAKALAEGSKLLKTIPDESKDRRVPDKLEPDGGWIPDDIVDYLSEHGEKLERIIYDIQTLKGKHVIYTTFKTYYGENLIASILQTLNIPYLTYDGEMDDGARQDVMTKFNHENNIRGKKYKVLIMTDSGAEGLNLLEVRYLHILEQSISEWLIKQVMGRVVRYRSHIRLPVRNRNVVIKRYFLDVESKFPKYGNATWSPDYYVYTRAMAKEKSISYLVGKVLPRLKVK